MHLSQSLNWSAIVSAVLPASIVARETASYPNEPKWTGTLRLWIVHFLSFLSLGSLPSWAPNLLILHSISLNIQLFALQTTSRTSRFVYSPSNISQSEGLSSSKSMKSVVYLSFYFFTLVEVFLFFNVFSFRRQMSHHETHRKHLKHTPLPWWTKRVNHNRNTYFNEKFELLFECFLATLGSFLATL